MKETIEKVSIVMMGSSGAVGSETVNALLQFKNIKRLTLLGRKTNPTINNEFV